MPESSNSKIHYSNFKITIKAGKDEKRELKTQNVKLKTPCVLPSLFLQRPETQELRS